jgi:hypothetical protein
MESTCHVGFGLLFVANRQLNGHLTYSYGSRHYSRMLIINPRGGTKPNVLLFDLLHHPATGSHILPQP